MSPWVVCYLGPFAIQMAQLQYEKIYWVACKLLDPFLSTKGLATTWEKYLVTCDSLDAFLSTDAPEPARENILSGMWVLGSFSIHRGPSSNVRKYTKWRVNYWILSYPQKAQSQREKIYHLICESLGPSLSTEGPAATWENILSFMSGLFPIRRGPCQNRRKYISPWTLS